MKSDSPKTCVLNNVAAYGQKTAAPVPTVEACTTSNCADCFAQSTVCVACQPAYAFKNDVANQCFFKATTAFYGPTPSDPLTLTLCSVSNCRLCSATFGECSECDASYALVSGRSDICQLTSSLYTGYGQDTGQPATLATIYLCLDAYCENCQADTRVCVLCSAASSRQLRKSDGRCYANTAAGYGQDPTLPSHLDQCLYQGCQDCFSDYRFCQVTASGKREMVLVRTSLDAATTEALVEFDSIVDTAPLKDELVFTLRDDHDLLVTSFSVLSLDLTQQIWLPYRPTHKCRHYQRSLAGQSSRSIHTCILLISSRVSSRQHYLNRENQRLATCSLATCSS